MAIGTPVHVKEVIERYGPCLEMIPMDPHFHNISIGFYVKDGIGTVWTYSQKPGAPERVRAIRDLMVAQGDMAAIEGTPHQAKFPCGYLHVKPVRFLLMQAVEKNPDYLLPEGVMSVQDTRSKMVITLTGRQEPDRYVYTITGDGNAPNPAIRLASIVNGFVKYGEMLKVSPTEVAFPCGARHDGLARLLLPYARNISAVDQMLDSTRGQLTTGTAGFTPN